MEDASGKLPSLALGALVLGIFILFMLLQSTRGDKFYPHIPVFGNNDIPRMKKEYRTNAYDMVAAAHRQNTGALQIVTDSGPRILLSPRYLNEIRNNKSLSFDEVLKDENGAEVFHAGQAAVQDGLLVNTVRTKLTQSLASLTVALSEEAADSISRLVPPSSEWRTMGAPVHSTTTEIVSQMSARAFLGDTLCRNKKWLRIGADYTMELVAAQKALRVLPRAFRPLLQYFTVEGRTLYRTNRAARALLSPVLKSRAESMNLRERASDALEWFTEVARAKKVQFDPVYTQLALTVVATHTTSATLSNILFDLVARPELIDELRKEIIDVLGPQSTDGGDGGWKKTSLPKLQLMDSVMKESQRLNPLEVLAVRRKVLEQITLSDGTVLPTGSTICVPSIALRDPAFFDNPDEFDGHRFLRLRAEEGNENKWHFVTTSQEMFAFGHGQHACPGRFFAGSEIKVALVHLLMKYDWSFIGPKQGIAARLKPFRIVDSVMPDPTVFLRYKDRKPEIEI